MMHTCVSMPHTSTRNRPSSRQRSKISPHTHALNASLSGAGPSRCFQLRHRRAELVRILLRRRDRHAERRGRVEQPADVPHDPLALGMTASNFSCASTTNSAESSRFINSGLRGKRLDFCVFSTGFDPMATKLTPGWSRHNGRQ